MFDVRATLIATIVVIVGCAAAERVADGWNATPAPAATSVDALARAGNGSWSAYGADAGGTRYSPLAEIDRTNVSGLEVAWTYRTGDLSDPERGIRGTRFEATPIVIWETLYFSTPFNRVIALDPETGEERWVFDPEVDKTIGYSEDLISRGVSAWEDPNAAPGTPCARRIFLGAMDARLFALDAVTGRPCSAFGEGGVVELKTPEVGHIQRGQYMVTSPPAIVDGAVVVGSAVGDNRGVELERGIVRGYDARTGTQLWAWDPVPRRPSSPAWSEWEPEDARVTGAANAWSIISADTARGLVFVPTGSASPDYWGGRRRGSNRWANSVVAIRARTGELVWGFQVVHHDLWDYDVASQPLLTELEVDGQTVPVVVQGTKMGHIFVLHRETGEPVFPVEERPVPASDVPGEAAWPTQPFPTHPAPLHPTALRPEDAFGPTESDRAHCRDAIASLRYEGIFTPPSLEGTIVYPGFVGGMNWGSAAFAHESNTLIVLLNRFPFWVKLLPRDSIAAFRQVQPRAEIARQQGAAYAMARAPLMGPSGAPCTPPAWGEVVAVDLGSGAVRWRTPLGHVPALAEAGAQGYEQWGSVGIGGPMVTAGGLVFAAASMDPAIRAYDIETGAVLWTGALPASGQATPMTFAGPASGRQFVVIAAGGHARLGTPTSDALVAFALPAR